MSIVKKYFLVFASIILSVKSFAQAPSPYSTFGIGEAYGNALVNAQGMGGIGVSQPQLWFLNNQNPALLVYNNLTVFQAGLVTEQRTVKSNSGSEKATGGNMNYLVTGFPVKPGRWSTSIGLMPMTSINYRLTYNTPIVGSTQLAEITEEGKGGLTQLYWGNGVRIHENWAVGAKITYIFSSTVNTYRNKLPATATPLSYLVAIEEQTYVKDFTFSFGASFSKDSVFNRPDYRFSVGLTYDHANAKLGGAHIFNADLGVDRTIKFLRTTTAGRVIEGDTLSISGGHIHLPSSLTFGTSLSKGSKWVIGTEFNFQDWSNFTSPSEDDEGLAAAWKWSVGGELTPDASSENFFKRVTLRLGLNYEKTPYLAPIENPKSVKDYGATFGMSIPAGRSSLDLAFKFGKRGNKDQNLLEESYFRVYFGITFNDQWFIKRKFD